MMRIVLLLAGCCWISASSALAGPNVDAALAAAPDLDSAGLESLCVNGPPRQANWGGAEAEQLVRLGWGKFGANDAASALKLFDAALNTGPERPDAYWGLAIAGHVAGRDIAAVDACFARAQALLPEVAGVFADHGRALESRGDFDAAIEKFRHALALDPEFREAHVGMARAMLAKGDDTGAQPHISFLQSGQSAR